MVNSAIDINKRNNHLSSQIIEHKKTPTYEFGNPCAGFGQAHKCGGVMLVNGIPILYSWYL